MDNFPSQLQFAIENLDNNLRLTLRQCLDSPDDFIEIIQVCHETPESEATIVISIQEAEKLQKGLTLLLEHMKSERTS